MKSTRHPTPLALAVLALSGCAFSDGQPWGQLHVSLEVAAETPAGRLDAEGRLITANDYALQLTTYTLTVDGLSLKLSSTGAGPSTFDPSSPPPGYTLCHNGHCHNEGGALVDYTDVEAELAGATAAGGATVTVETPQAVVDLTTGGGNVTLGACPDDCQVGAGTLATVEVAAVSLTVQGRAFDRRTGDARRLPEEGVAISATLPLGAPLSAAAAAHFGRNEPLDATVKVLLTVAPTTFDAVDWAAPVNAAALTPLVREALSLSASVTQ